MVRFYGGWGVGTGLNLKRHILSYRSIALEDLEAVRARAVRRNAQIAACGTIAKWKKWNDRVNILICVGEVA